MIQFIYQALASQSPPEAHTLKIWFTGGADLKAVQDRYGIRTLGLYGMTETVSACTFTERWHRTDQGSCGVPLPGYEIKVVDERGEEVPQGQSGHVKVRGIRGIHLFSEYLNDPEAARFVSSNPKTLLGRWETPNRNTDYVPRKAPLKFLYSQIPPFASDRNPLVLWT